MTTKINASVPAVSDLTNRTHDLAGRSDLRVRASDLAVRAGRLAREIDELYADFCAAAPEPVGSGRVRCLGAADGVRDAVRYLREMDADLVCIQAAAAPGVCPVPWGVCPEHGDTLMRLGGQTVCRVRECGRTWECDRASLPCTEPARWAVTDMTGGTGAMCDGHARDARHRIVGATVAPLAGHGEPA